MQSEAVVSVAGRSVKAATISIRSHVVVHFEVVHEMLIKPSRTIEQTDNV